MRTKFAALFLLSLPSIPLAEASGAKPPASVSSPVQAPSPAPVPPVASNPGPTPVQNPSPAPAPVTVIPPGGAEVINGWISDYTSFVETTVAKLYPQLLQLPAARMTRVCPDWATLNAASRQEFWSALLQSITSAESAQERTAIYLETTMGNDPVTGYQVRSEGLLQLSYQDVQNYNYGVGDISWAEDKAKAIQDYDSGTTHGNPNRTILDAYANMDLGLFIMNKLLLTYNPSASFDAALGRYWYSMQSAHAPFTDVVASLKSHMPSCFE